MDWCTSPGPRWLPSPRGSTGLIKLGHMVSGNTYRHPALTAKMAAQIDIISGGRFILGLGAAWQENEHHAYGIHFGTLKERMDFASRKHARS